MHTSLSLSLPLLLLYLHIFSQLLTISSTYLYLYFFSYFTFRLLHNPLLYAHIFFTLAYLGDLLASLGVAGASEVRMEHIPHVLLLLQILPPHRQQLLLRTLALNGRGKHVKSLNITVVSVVLVSEPLMSFFIGLSKKHNWCHYKEGVPPPAYSPTD